MATLSFFSCLLCQCILFLGALGLGGKLSSPASTDPTCNTPTNRACWLDGFDIQTDWETSTPTTGCTRKYTFKVTEIDDWVSPGGVRKSKAMLVNGQFPGPTISADWGDFIQVRVINNLRTNGTSFHWHGLHQQDNNINDGVNGVTECPIPPGHQKTYHLQATQYGTSWYHSHTSSQLGNGLVGPIQINGPASASYDIDLGVFPLSDWYYGAADQLLALVNEPVNPFDPDRPGTSPPSDDILFNGSSSYLQTGETSRQADKSSEVMLTPGKTHRLRLINTSVDNSLTVSLVGHSLVVIATDLVPVQPLEVRYLFVGVGQRYDVLITADQPVGSYWFNASLSAIRCGQTLVRHPAAVFRYDGVNTSLPTDRGLAPPDQYCEDSNAFVPIVTRLAPLADFDNDSARSLPVTFEAGNGTNSTVNRLFWKVNSSAIDVQWDRPTLEYIRDGDTKYPRSANVITLPSDDTWTFWLVENLSPLPHPMHLHGHDFLIIGRSPALADPEANGPRRFNQTEDTPLLRGDNPTRRDTTMLPGFGWLLVAFRARNPGAWLFHCHVAWHLSQGLSVQFVEGPDEIPRTVDLGGLEPNCAAWRAYYPTDPFRKVDSGV